MTNGLPAFRPLHLLALALILTPFLSQNHYHQVRNIFSTLGVFTLMLVIWPLIGVTFLWVNLAAFDPLMAYTVDRMAAITFTGVGIGHLLFILLNHRATAPPHQPLLPHGRWPAGDLQWYGSWGSPYGYLQGSESWKTPRLLSHGYAIQQETNNWLEGEANELPPYIGFYWVGQ